MLLLDSNIIIYSILPTHQKLRDFLSGNPFCCSVITKVEVLGYHLLSPKEKLDFENLFNAIPLVPISTSIIEKAIQIKQIKRVTLGDSLIAATALDIEAELVTANSKDFEGIFGLKVTNPL
jgi:toxin FitB